MRHSYLQYTQLAMNNSNYIVFSQPSLSTEIKYNGGRDRIVVGTVIKSKIGDLEEEVRADSSIRTRK